MAYQGWSDFRSDTVTRPTPEMYRAMTEAELGDDVLGDDPTVKELEETAAEMIGKEAAVFVPSGTMGNTIALKVHDSRGREVLLEEKSHVLLFEAGNIGNLIGAIPHPLPSKTGTMRVSDLAAAYKAPGNMHVAPSAGICLENSHNYHGGAVVSLADMQAMSAFAREKKLFLHLDGARVFNAACALGVSAADIAAPCDSIMFCLSKGLSAPIGSILAGKRDFIAAARLARKQFGGALRQSGILAACGLVALKVMSGRLAEDHRRARRLAEGLAAVAALRIDPDQVQTNIIIVELAAKGLENVAVCAELKKEGVLALPFGPGRIRMITHKDIDDADVERALLAWKKVTA